MLQSFIGFLEYAEISESNESSAPFRKTPMCHLFIILRHKWPLIFSVQWVGKGNKFELLHRI